MNIGKALGIIGLTIVGSILAAVGVRVTLNAIDGKPLLEPAKTETIKNNKPAQKK